MVRALRAGFYIFRYDCFEHGASSHNRGAGHRETMKGATPTLSLHMTVQRQALLSEGQLPCRHSMRWSQGVRECFMLPSIRVTVSHGRVPARALCHGSGFFGTFWCFLRACWLELQGSGFVGSLPQVCLRPVTMLACCMFAFVRWSSYGAACVCAG